MNLERLFLLLEEYTMKLRRVSGNLKKNKVVLYALSTCGWCKKTKALLTEKGVEYEYIDLDTAKPEDRKEAIDDLKKRSLPLSVPIIIIDDVKVIRGYKPDEFKEVLQY